MSKKDETNLIEVEIRALIKDPVNLISKLEKTGCIFVSKSSLHDIYFCGKSLNKIEDVEMHEVGSYSLRTRSFTDKSGTINTLNTKSITRTGDHNAWEEHETEIGNFEQMSKILVATEFKPFFEIEKVRTEYKYNNLGVFIEDIKDFGFGIEIEILTSIGKEESAKEEIFSFLASIDISRSSVVPKSITNIIMKERAFKKEIHI